MFKVRFRPSSVYRRSGDYAMNFLRSFVFVLLLGFCRLLHAQTPTDITANLTFTTIDVPGAGATFVMGMNSAGDMVGLYGKTNYNDRYRGFVLRAGQFTSFFYPGAMSTWGMGINDSGLILGYATGLSREIGFLYDGTTFTPIKYGNKSATATLDINNSGDIVGGEGTLGSTI